MKKFIFALNFVIWMVVGSLSAQEYNEETVRKELDKYIDNPKLFYERLKSLSEKAEKANQNTMKVSEEYLSLLDKKDSLIRIYKNQAMAAKSAKVASPTESAAVPVTTYPNTKTSASAATVKASSPYRVQLAAFFRDDFAKFFGTFNKTLGVQKLDNRNVIEVQGFKDSLEAQEFSQKIKQLGFPGAFVAKYDENGIRQEGYQLIKGNSNSNAVAKTPTKPANYPNWVPLGYQEITNTRETVKLSPSNNSTANPAVSTPPVMRKSVTAQASVPIAVHPSSTTATPKTLATVTPTSSSTPASTSKPAPASPKAAMPTKVNTADQLDAAFDQLFKR